MTRSTAASIDIAKPRGTLDVRVPFFGREVQIATGLRPRPEVYGRSHGSRKARAQRARKMGTKKPRRRTQPVNRPR